MDLYHLRRTERQDPSRGKARAGDRQERKERERPRIYPDKLVFRMRREMLTLADEQGRERM
jgi:hypothetical protein